MPTRTSPSRLLLALAGTAGLGAVVAWWMVPEGLGHELVEFTRAAHAPVERGPTGGELVAVSSASLRTSSLPIALSESPCLEYGHTSITGRVVDEEGEPVPAAKVAILAAPHAADGLKSRGESLTDELGSFDVRTAKPGDVWVVAYAPDRRPTVHRLVVDEGFVDLVQPLRLERGAAISGRVLASGEPLSKVELEAVAPRFARRIRVGEDELALIDGRIEWGTPRCTTDADGAWSFGGLAPGTWMVRPHAFRCPGAVFPPGALAPESIRAPSSDVDLLIPSAKLALDVVADGEPLAWAEVEVEYRGIRSARRADARGRLEVDVSPNEGIAVVVRAPGRSASREIVAGPQRGERREMRVSAGPPAPNPGSGTRGTLSRPGF